MVWTIEADGGSRGNPGPAAYGAALLRDGEPIAERGLTIGIATNNVAEYSGLIAGLEFAREFAGGEPVEVRMDSKLVIEQMAGRWKIKHPDMKPLALKAQTIVRELGPITWTWVPREKNKRADALANAALDEQKAGRDGLVERFGASQVPATATPVVALLADEPPEPPEQLSFEVAAQEVPAVGPTKPDGNTLVGWRGSMHGDPTTVIMVRHGVTDQTVRKLFSGSGGANPGLNADGIEQARRAGAWLATHGGADVLLASPLQRTQDTAAHIAAALDVPVVLDSAFAEAAFGEWDGHSFAEILERWPAELQAWLASTAVAPPGGETFDAVATRVEAGLARVRRDYAGQTVVVVSHVTPIKMTVRAALDAPIAVIHKMELAPASITTVSWWPDGVSSLRNFSLVP